MEQLTENDLRQDGVDYPEITEHLISLWRKGTVDAQREPNGRVRYRAIVCAHIIDDKGTPCGKPCDLSYTYGGGHVCADCFEILCEADKSS
jgi:DNA-binding transcriptional ArsR family regulator